MFRLFHQNPRLRPHALAVLISSAIFPAISGAETTTESENNSSTITVVADAEETFSPGGEERVPAYLEGQIANGGRLGMFGQQKAMDVPFNVISFTGKMLQDQQTQTIKDVVRNDASVQNVQGFGNFAETYRIRGFQLDGDDMTLGGLPGIIPRQAVDTAMVDRVEIFKGANSLLNGAAESGSGGAINLEAKRAEDTPLARVGIDYASSSQPGVKVDAGRRFGENNQFGARVNLVHREGETAVDDDKRRTTLASLGLDYRGDKLRSSLDLGYQKKTFHGGRLGINISEVNFIPDVPDASHNYSQPWVYSDIESQFAMARFEYDLNDHWSAYGGFGGQHSHEEGNYASPKLINRQGDATLGRLDTNNIVNTFSGMAGLRGNFATGFITHKVNLGYAAQTRRTNMAYRMASNPENTNIYDNAYTPKPAGDIDPGDYDDPFLNNRSRTQGYLLSDTLGVLDDRLLFTVGARYQKVVVRNYDVSNGREQPDSRFNGHRWMPTYGVVYKPWKQISLYANHTESLQPGKAAPGDASNFGESTGIAHSKQNEAGIKFDYGQVGGSLALFEITQPLAISDAQNRYGLNGEQRHRGLELNVFGEPVFGLRLNGSATWLDPRITRSQDGQFDGHQAVGVPRYNLALGAEYDIRPVPGLTATALVNHSGSQFANNANSKKLDNFTTLDLGVRYSTFVNQGKNEMVWRAGVDNVTNEKYWSGVEKNGTYLFQGSPRTFKLSVGYDF